MNASVQQSVSSADDGAPINVEQRGPIAWLTLNRGQKYNALSAAMIAELKTTLERLGEDRAIRVIVLGASGRAFSAGHDLSEMGPDVGLEAMRTLFNACADLMLTIQKLPQPVIARVQGVATAAGCQLVASCDLAVASSDARFAVSGINLGLFCSTPAVAISRNMLQKPALEMLLTGDFIDARTACERGLVNRVVPADQLDAEVEKLAGSIASKSADAIAAGKRLFYQQRELTIDAAYRRAADVMAQNAILEETQKGIARFSRRG